MTPQSRYRQKYLLSTATTTLMLLTSSSISHRCLVSARAHPARIDVPVQRKDNLNTKKYKNFPNNNNFWNDGSSDGGDEEIESSSDFEDWWAPPAQPQHVTETRSKHRNAEQGSQPSHKKESKASLHHDIGNSSCNFNSSSNSSNNNHDNNSYLSSVRGVESPSSTRSSVEITPSKPLQTLEKLQRMLDDSDYITSTSAVTSGNRVNSTTISAGNSSSRSLRNTTAADVVRSNTTATSRLWTSQDRERYRQQQRRQQAAAQVPPLVQTPPNTVEEETNSETDDNGLGYSLPNLPVYMSDADESDFDSATSTAYPATVNNPTPSSFSTNKLQSSSSQHIYPTDGDTRLLATSHLPGQHYDSAAPNTVTHQPFDQPQYPQTPYTYPPMAPYQNPYFSPYSPYSQHLYGLSLPMPTLTQQPQQSFNPWGTMPHSPYQAIPHQMHSLPQSNPFQQSDKYRNDKNSGNQRQAEEYQQQHAALPAIQAIDATNYDMVAAQSLPKAQSLAEASSNLNFASIQKIAVMITIVALGSYASVSPRSLPLEEYNLKFYDNLRTVLVSAVAPILNMLAVFDARENDINTVLNTFFVSFTVGHTMAFGAEVLLTTIIRLMTFYWFEPKIFELAPTVPLPVLPWIVREQKYRPKRITLFVADLVASCVAAPIVEEFIKLRMLQWTVHLRKNYEIHTKTSRSSGKKRRVLEGLVRGPVEGDVTNANQYVTHMLAASLGFKLFDTSRRILLYTKPMHRHKGFFAMCRGVFPIHELCGTMTALGLAKRDLLGVDMPLWKVLLPAVVIHGMANFRGMKPVFKWNSATPWSEMQLYPLDFADSSTLPQLLSKGFAKLMWLVILGRVLGYCIKNYYMVNRQAVKRTTTYAGKQAAFSAELVTADILKRHH